MQGAIKATRSTSCGRFKNSNASGRKPARQRYRRKLDAAWTGYRNLGKNSFFRMQNPKSPQREHAKNSPRRRSISGAKG